MTATCHCRHCAENGVCVQLIGSRRQSNVNVYIITSLLKKLTSRYACSSSLARCVGRRSTAHATTTDRQTNMCPTYNVYMRKTSQNTRNSSPPFSLNKAPVNFCMSVAMKISFTLSLSIATCRPSGSEQRPCKCKRPFVYYLN